MSTKYVNKLISFVDNVDKLAPGAKRRFLKPSVNKKFVYTFSASKIIKILCELQMFEKFVDNVDKLAK